MKFNIFDPYLFIIHKVTFCCPPINRDRFEREFRNRYRFDDRQEQEPTNCSVETCATFGGGSRLLWVILHPIKAHKLVRDYYMVENIYVISQVLYILILLHLFIKSTIHTVVAGSDKEKIQFFDSIYYPHIVGFSSRPYVFNYLILGYSFYFLLVRIFRFCMMIDISMNNQNTYKDFRFSQLNNSYLAIFYLSLQDWLRFFKYIVKHENFVHSNEETRLDHLSLDKSVQQSMFGLSDKDAMFFVNPIDFEKCFADSLLPKHFERRDRYKSWHFAHPIHRISPLGLRDVILIGVFGTLVVLFGYLMTCIAVLYLELRSEFPADYSPSIIEILSVVPAHWSKLLHWIRVAELSVISTSQVLNLYDLVSIFFDIHTIRGRTHKLVRIFKNHLDFIRNQTKFDDEKFISVTQSKRTRIQHFTNREFDLYQSGIKSYDPYFEYNKQIRQHTALVRINHNELLNTRKHHKKFFNMFIIGGAINIAFLIPIILSQPISAETCITFSVLMSSLIPIVGILLFCTRMERMVSYLILLLRFTHDE